IPPVPLHGPRPAASLSRLSLLTQLIQELSYRLGHDPSRLRISVGSDQVASDRIDPHRASIGNPLHVRLDERRWKELILRTDDNQLPGLDRGPRGVTVAVEPGRIANPATTE